MLTLPHWIFSCDTAVVRTQRNVPKEGRLEAAPHTSPVPAGVVQGAACPQWFIVIVAPAQEGQCCPEGRRQPHTYHQGDGRVPCQLAS